ncbi:MAG TPA: hypothetical protein VHU80_02940 [Polyangiaceae bacterium]|jgi:hypothetical protein|nr:hypothetical protein [Polyangiaceae bacterium]
MLAMTAAGCSSGTPEGSSKSHASPAEPIEDATANLASPLSVTITIPQVAPGEENTKCLKVRLPNANAIEIGRVHNLLSEASHHLVVSAVTDPTETESDLFDCAPFRAVLIGAPLTVSQKKDDTILFPEGVAFPLEAAQLMHLEMHYINTGTDPVDVTATTNLYPLAAPGKDIQEASFLIIGTLAISLPPNSEHENPWSYVPMPDAFDGVNIYGATGHTHRFGTAARLAISGPNGADSNTIYDPSPYTWSEAQLKFFDQPVHVPQGGGFNFQCAWNNPTDAVITYGESALQEMCFFWTYYYPRREGTRTLITGLDQSPYVKGKDAGTAAQDAGAK